LQMGAALERVANGDAGALASVAQLAAGAAGVQVPPQMLSALEGLASGKLTNGDFLEELLKMAASSSKLPPEVTQVFSRLGRAVANGGDVKDVAAELLGAASEHPGLSDQSELALSLAQSAVRKDAAGAVKTSLNQINFGGQRRDRFDRDELPTASLSETIRLSDVPNTAL
ncbi:MAG: hypothetical protein AAF449_10440, partial [Myxococcota bacterium]